MLIFKMIVLALIAGSTILRCYYYSDKPLIAALNVLGHAFFAFALIVA